MLGYILIWVDWDGLNAKFKPKPKTKYFLFFLFPTYFLSPHLPTITSTSHQSQTILFYLHLLLSPTSHHTFTLLPLSLLFLPFVCLFFPSAVCTVTSTHHFYHLQINSSKFSRLCFLVADPGSYFIVSFCQFFFFYIFSPTSFLPQDFTLTVWKFSYIHILARNAHFSRNTKISPEMPDQAGTSRNLGRCGSRGSLAPDYPPERKILAISARMERNSKHLALLNWKKLKLPCQRAHS